MEAATNGRDVGKRQRDASEGRDGRPFYIVLSVGGVRDRSLKHIGETK